MSTLKADAITSASSNTDVVITANGSGKVDVESGLKISGTTGIPISELRAGTDGELITWDASGVAATVGVGSATNVLTSNGAGSAPTFQAAAGGGSWNFIGTALASNSATVTVTGLNSTYDTFVIAISDMVPATDAANLNFRLGDASGIDTTSGDYRYHSGVVVDNSTVYAATSSTSDSEIRIGGGIGNATGEGIGAMLYLTQPGDATTFPKLIGHWTSISGEPRTRGGTVHGHRTAVITVDRVQVLMHTGNITSGRMTVWGIAHA